MKYIKYLLIGIFFGIIMSKAEIVSWYRIYEMFRFESFHMYGVIGTAVVLGVIFVLTMKILRVRSFRGNPIDYAVKKKSAFRYIIGGTIFGLGWAMTGACPGPMFVLLGKGVFTILIVIFGAVLGTFLYGVLRDKLPH
ncbi:MAG: YeeE/YedE family protein [Bacteroidetes bacterium]|nr:YeeE/YedE family protein [Bacteroidota bacterium]